MKKKPQPLAAVFYGIYILNVMNVIVIPAKAGIFMLEALPVIERFPHSRE